MDNRAFITTAGYIILLRLLDLGLTFIYTPKLHYEWNPIVSVFGYSWLGMLITQVLLISFIIFVMSFYFYKKPIVDPPNDLSFKEYIYYYFHNKRHIAKKKWLPFNRRSLERVLAYNGFILMTLAICVSYLAIINNLLIINNVKAYSLFIYRYSDIFFPALMAVLAVSSFYLFFIMEYRTYKNKIEKVAID